MSTGKAFESVRAMYLKDLLPNSVESLGRSRSSWWVECKLRLGYHSVVTYLGKLFDQFFTLTFSQTCTCSACSVV